MATLNNNPIKSFSVFGLFGTKDVEITFEDNIKILVGENGMGKTQILNLLYCVLTKDVLKLYEFNFLSLVIVFHKKKTVTILKKNIEEYIRILIERGLVSKKIFDSDKADELANIRKFLHIYKQNAEDFFKYTDSVHMREISFSYRLVRQIYDFESKIFEKWFNKIGTLNIIYYPTYRRIESSWYDNNMGVDYQSGRRRMEDFDMPVSMQSKKIEIEQKYNPMRFGMDDIKNCFIQIKENIENLQKEGFSEFSKDILSAVIEDTDVSKTENILETINEKDINIILARVGDSLTAIQKENIKNIIAQKKIKNPLSVYLLQKLLSIYEKQQPIDNIVKTFKNVCNKYLIDKAVFYDESSIEIGVKSTITDEIIDLSLLSSGEKQILSIFANLYLLETEKNFMILFDEPELSLSILWQKELLPDMVASGKCDFLLAVTHSPFIFDNNLDKYAMALSEYISPTKMLN